MKRFILAIILVLFLTIPSFGGSVVLQWDENIESDLAGYQILQSDSSGGPYTIVEEIPPNYHEIDITLPNDTDRDSYRVVDLVDGVYFWVLTAFDNEVPRMVSGYSNEVTMEIITPPPSDGAPVAPIILTITEE